MERRIEFEMKLRESAPTEEPKQAPLSFESSLLEEASGLTGRCWQVVVIAEGWSKNGVYYSREALEGALHLFEGCPVQIYSHYLQSANHLPTSERKGDIESPGGNNVGFTHKVRGEVGESGRYEVRALFECTDPVVAQKLLRQWQANVNVLGLSIDAEGRVELGEAAGRKGMLVKSLNKICETTMVSQPAAGGRVVQLVAGLDSEKENVEVNKLKKWLTARLQKSGTPLDLAGMDDKRLCEAVMAVLKADVGDQALLALAIDWLGAGKTEEVAQLLQKMIEIESTEDSLDPVMAGPMASMMESVKSEVNALRAERRAAVMTRVLAESALPASAQAVIRKRFQDQHFEEVNLQEAVTDMRAVLAENFPAPGGVLQEQSISLGFGDIDKFSAQMDLVCGYNYAKDTRLTEAQRDLYRNLGSPRIKGLYQRWTDDGDCSFAKVGPNALLHEAVSSSFPQILGVSMEKSVIQQYRDLEAIWKPLVYINPDVDNFKTQTRIQLGGFSGLPVVSESDSADTYTQLATPREEYSTYGITTRGGLFSLTRVMIKNDDMQIFRDLPKRLGKAAAYQVRKFVYSLAIGNAGGGGINTDTTYDGLVLYHATHGNTATGALTQTTLNAGRLALKNQRTFAARFQLGAAALANATSLTLVSTSGLVTDDYLQVDSEIYRVTSVASSTVVNVAPAQLGTTSASHLINAYALQLSESIPLSRIHVIVPDELESTLMTILNSEQVTGSANNDYNMLYTEYKAGRLVPHVQNAQYLGGDITNWYMAAEAQDLVSLEMAFMDNRQDPEILYQDDPRVDKVFARDNYTYKVRHEYHGKQVDWRGLYGAIVAG